jgi:hypothetical protein
MSKGVNAKRQSAALPREQGRYLVMKLVGSNRASTTKVFSLSIISANPATAGYGVEKFISNLANAPSTINLRLGAVRRLAYEAADCSLLSADLAAGIQSLLLARFTTKHMAPADAGPVSGIPYTQADSLQETSPHQRAAISEMKS